MHSFNGLFDAAKYGIQKLGVPDLRRDLRRRGGFARGKYCARYPLGGCPDQLDLPRVRRPQGRLRDGPDLNLGVEPLAGWVGMVAGEGCWPGAPHGREAVMRRVRVYSRVPRTGWFRG